MDMDSEGFLLRYFERLTGHRQPYPWQQDLFAKFVELEFPRELPLPTGAGKTSVMVLWLLALVYRVSAEKGLDGFPRRLAWVVDRRVVVDQATDEAGRMVERLRNRAPELAAAVANVSVSGERTGVPIAISTLRGEFADNREWSIDPSRPSIIVGTVDMIGSRLLFSGYGDGRRRRPLHAALLGQDCLIVNDEAHLNPAFADLLREISNLASSPHPLRVMFLSATLRNSNGMENRDALFSRDLEDPEFAKRCTATKELQLIESPDPKKTILELALQPAGRTVIFVRSPEHARQLADQIAKRQHGISVPVITGRQRGWEREAFLARPEIQPFLPGAAGYKRGPAWLVATSAGEVGIDFSADRLITDLDTAEHMLQRFGRLNRYGESAEATAVVVWSEKRLGTKKDQNARLRATLDYLKKLPDISPLTLILRPPPEKALERLPNYGPLDRALVAGWSLTSLSSRDWPSRPQVQHWLRGDEASPAETVVAWRSDVEELVEFQVPIEDIEEVFECFPIRAHERLRWNTEALITELKQSKHTERAAILVTADGEIRTGRLYSFLAEPSLLRYGTLILPQGVGMLDANGMVDWSEPKHTVTGQEDACYDVSELDPRHPRCKVKVGVDEPEPKIPLRKRHTVSLVHPETEEMVARWIYYSGPLQGKEATEPERSLEDHSEMVAQVAHALAERLSLAPALRRVLVWAARWHDAGKDSPIWQFAAGNRNGSKVLAKSARFVSRRLGGYRHELGSLLDVRSRIPPEFTDEDVDLAMQMIAAHHGWSRPHFPERAYDRRQVLLSRDAATESMQRFGRLLTRFNPWEEAFLESLLRAADAIGSLQESELPANA